MRKDILTELENNLIEYKFVGLCWSANFHSNWASLVFWGSENILSLNRVDSVLSRCKKSCQGQTKLTSECGKVVLRHFSRGLVYMLIVNNTFLFNSVVYSVVFCCFDPFITALKS